MSMRKKCATIVAAFLLALFHIPSMNRTHKLFYRKLRIFLKTIRTIGARVTAKADAGSPDLHL